MMVTPTNKTHWPQLDYASWPDTLATLQLWTQIVGKIRLRCMPWTNHSWHVTLYVTPRGLTTGSMPHGTQTFVIEFDFIEHVLRIQASNGLERHVELRSRETSDFYAAVMRALEECQVPVAINIRPNEIANAIAFPGDHEHKRYDGDAVQCFWRVLIQVDRIFSRFRAGFLGKASPVHFFWGSFDLAVTRFSGREAPDHPGGAPNLPLWVAQEAYSHELSSAGFWPGSPDYPEAIFYSYAYPAPPGFADVDVEPEAAIFSATLGEFVLPYSAVRNARDPEEALFAFLQSTFAAAVRCAQWDLSKYRRRHFPPDVAQ